MDWKLGAIVASVMLGGAFFATPALAQEAEGLPAAVEAQTSPLAAEVAQVDPEAGLVNGVFGLTLEGEVPENFSFYAEANIGSGGEVICTTDAEMVGVGYPECVGGGAVNEVSFVAPDGQNIQYRILGSQGVELSQKVISEGSAVASEGVRIDASYAFGPEPLEDFSESPIQDPEWEPDVDEDQYGEVSSGAIEGTAEETMEPTEGEGGGDPRRGGRRQRRPRQRRRHRHRRDRPPPRHRRLRPLARHRGRAAGQRPHHEEAHPVNA